MKDSFKKPCLAVVLMALCVGLVVFSAALIMNGNRHHAHASSQKNYITVTNTLGYRLAFVLDAIEGLGASNTVVYIVSQHGKSQCLCIISNNVAQVYPEV